MMVPPGLRRPLPVVVSEEQKFLGRLALVVGVVLVPFGLFVYILVVVAAGSSRFAPLAALLGLLPLFGFCILGVVWGLMEWSRREVGKRANQEYENKLTDLRTQASRRLDEWHADLARTQDQARLQYEREFRVWQKADSTCRAEAKHQKEQWEKNNARRQEEARKQYDRDFKVWNDAAEPICADARQQRIQLQHCPAGRGGRATSRRPRWRCWWQRWS